MLIHNDIMVFLSMYHILAINIISLIGHSSCVFVLDAVRIYEFALRNCSEQTNLTDQSFHNLVCPIYSRK